MNRKQETYGPQYYVTADGVFKLIPNQWFWDEFRKEKENGTLYDIPDDILESMKKAAAKNNGFGAD